MLKSQEHITTEKYMRTLKYMRYIFQISWQSEFLKHVNMEIAGKVIIKLLKYQMKLLAKVRKC